MKIINFFNGKKTYIGAAIMFLSCFLEQVVINIWGVDAAWVIPTMKTLDWIGMSVFGLGASHKAIKTLNTTK